jgi:hypothetical protein
MPVAKFLRRILSAKWPLSATAAKSRVGQVELLESRCVLAGGPHFGGFEPPRLDHPGFGPPGHHFQGDLDRHFRGGDPRQQAWQPMGTVDRQPTIVVVYVQATPAILPVTTTPVLGGATADRPSSFASADVTSTVQPLAADWLWHAEESLPRANDAELVRSLNGAAQDDDSADQSSDSRSTAPVASRTVSPAQTTAAADDQQVANDSDELESQSGESPRAKKARLARLRAAQPRVAASENTDARFDAPDSSTLAVFQLPSRAQLAETFPQDAAQTIDTSPPIWNVDDGLVELLAQDVGPLAERKASATAVECPIPSADAGAALTAALGEIRAIQLRSEDEPAAEVVAANITEVALTPEATP